MDGNPAYHAVALAAATLLMLPPAVAMLAGWTPPRLSSRAVVVPYAWAMVCLYANAPLNAVPRMLGAAPGVVTACMVVGLAFSAAAVALLVRAARAAQSLASKIGG
ncbi:hypothetical protein ACGFYF_02670 [Streptomyces lavendulae]|uniref:hypothetical protein n=1 Tax=Streptomyces lavendulae TaxID=1914 RepID=UPI00371F4F43